MCDFGIAEYTALALAAAGAGATYVGQSQANAAEKSAVEQEALRQQQLQQRQQAMMAQQDAARDKARDIFNTSVLQQIDKNNVQSNEDTQAARLNDIFSQAATNTASKADPTAASGSVATVAPASAGSDAGTQAYNSSLAKNLARAIGFSTQQAGAKANVAGRQYAAQEQQRQLGLTAEQIGQQNDYISGMGRNIVNVGNLMDASNADAQAQINAASHKGDTWKTVGTLSNLVSSLFGGWGAAFGAGSSAYGSKAKPTLANTGGNGAAAQRYYSATTGQRIN